VSLRHEIEFWMTMQIMIKMILLKARITNKLSLLWTQD